MPGWRVGRGGGRERGRKRRRVGGGVGGGGGSVEMGRGGRRRGFVGCKGGVERAVVRVGVGELFDADKGER